MPDADNIVLFHLHELSDIEAETGVKTVQTEQEASKKDVGHDSSY